MLRPEPAVEDVVTVGGLPDEVAGSPWLPPVRQRTRAWAVMLQGLAGGPGAPAAADLDVKVFGG